MEDKSTSSILAAGCPLRLRLYPPAFTADLSSTVRLRSISTLPIGSIPSIRPVSTVAALCVHTPCLLAWVLTPNFVLDEGGLPVVPSDWFMLLILPSLEHPFRFRIDVSVRRTHSRVLVVTRMLARDCMNARSQLQVCPLACSPCAVGVAAAVKSG